MYVSSISRFGVYCFLHFLVGDPEYYKSILVKALGNDFSTFTIEKKADAKFKVVSAASIIAKVTRDSLLRQWDDMLRGGTLPAEVEDKTRTSELKRNFQDALGAGAG